MALLEVKNVFKSYEREILHDLNFCVQKGEVIGIIGESGCGKSTLAKLLCGIEKQNTGDILFEVQKNKIREIQMIFQNPIESFSPRMKIKQFLYEPYHYYEHLNKKEALPLIIEMIHQVGMNETCLDKYPHELSGGQLQRIAIARALIVKPTLLICDEITSSLDQIIQDDIICLLKQFVQNKDTSILFISHDLSLVQQFCKRVIVLKDGKIIEKGTIQQLYKSENEVVQNLLKAAYLNG